MATDVSDLIDAFTTWANDGADTALRTLADDLQQACPVNANPGDDGRAPGTLRDSLETVDTGRGDVWSAEIAFTDEAATWTDEGTDPHPIDPVNAKVLRWLSSGGTVVFARHVEHPGTAGTRWWTERMTDDNWAQAVEEALDAQGSP